jgi:excisionase family DNA binding protein
MGADENRRTGEQFPMNTEPITVREAAQQAGVSPNAIYNAIAAGDLPVIRVGTAVRILPEDWYSYLTRPPRKMGPKAKTAVPA